MMVTEISKQKRDPNKANVFIDGVFSFALHTQDIAYFKLKEGQEVSEEVVAFIQDNLVYMKAQDTALHYIGYRMRTEKEVRQKLQDKEYLPETIERVIEFSKKYRYINDEEYAKKYVQEKLRLKPEGAFALKMALLQKGIKEEICERVLTEAEMNEAEDALRWLEKKTRGIWPANDKKKKQLFDFLRRKGYGYEIINEAFRRMEEGEA